MTPLKLDPREVGRRIQRARADAGIKDYRELAKLLSASTGNKPRKPLSPETVRRWEQGLTFPPWDKIEQLGELLHMPLDRLLFGRMRHAQITAEKPRLQYTSDDESLLLTYFRQASDAAQKRILKIAEQLSADDPAELAQVHAIRAVSGAPGAPSSSPEISAGPAHPPPKKR